MASRTFNTDIAVLGEVVATLVRSDLTGNSGTTTRWKTARTITLTGGGTGSGSIDGSANLSIATAVAAHLHEYVPLSGGSGVGKAMTGDLWFDAFGSYIKFGTSNNTFSYNAWKINTSTEALISNGGTGGFAIKLGTDYAIKLVKDSSIKLYYTIKYIVQVVLY